ncbi:hypothetical protein ACFGVR_21270 [Mucilaginibacter sp. AW1-3]
MKLTICLLLLLIFPDKLTKSKSLAQNFDVSAFYAVLASGKTDNIDKELNILTSGSLPEKEAYEGTLLMRKAGLVKIPAEKLRLFKKGRIKLETALKNDNDNAEYHFLRLIIQEHAPKIVKYSADIDADMQFVKASYKNMPQAIKQAVIDYTKSSKVLHLQDL